MTQNVTPPPHLDTSTLSSPEKSTYQKNKTKWDHNIGLLAYKFTHIIKTSGENFALSLRVPS